MNKLLVLAALLMLSGCTIYKSDRLMVWGICYEDRAILPNGLYESQEIKLRCRGGHEQLHFKYNLNSKDRMPNRDPLDFKNKLKEFKED